MDSKDTIEENLCHAAARLAGKGLMQPGDILSQRLPELNAFVRVELRTLQDVPDTVFWVALTERPDDAHHRIYRARADVGAILASQQTWAMALAQMDRSMPGVFDEQIRHLGLQVQRISQFPKDAALSTGANAFALDRHILCFGMTLEKVMLNAELLEKCAKAYILAAMTGQPVKRIPWLVRYIANRRLRRDEKLAAASHDRGERAVPKAGY